MSRIQKFDHKVEIMPLSEGKSLMVNWQGFQGRHDYFMAESLEDLDILVTELSQAMHNFKRKQLIYRFARK